MRLDAPLDDLFLNRSHVRVLRALHGLPGGFRASGRELARRAGITHPPALKALALLVNTGVVMVERGSAGDLYSLNHEHVFAADVARLFNSETAIGAELISFVGERLHALAPDVKTATLFGSTVWGQPIPDSDIDVAVSCSPGDVEGVENALGEIGDAVWRRYGKRLSPLLDSGMSKRASGIWKRIETDGIPLIRSGKPVAP